MIKKSFIAFMFFVLTYALLIKVITINWPTAQNQFQANYISAQKFLFNKENQKPNIILGTSLSMDFPSNKLPDNFYNLAFRAYSVYDGFEILKHSDYVPENIYIEDNFLSKAPNEKFQNGLFKNPKFIINQYFPFTHEKNSPVGIVGPQISDKITDPIINFFQTKKETVNNKNLKEKNLKVIINQTIKVHSIKPKLDIINKNKSLLTDYINYFESKGSKIIFYQMPVLDTINLLPLFSETRLSFKPIIVNHNFISVPDFEIITRDGLHLNENSKLAYIEYFLNQTEKY